jgi:hypothetical protein
MFRMFTTAAILALTITAGAQAEESLTSRIHDAAVEACAVENNAGKPALYYSALTQHCVDRISAAAVIKYQAQADAKTMASTAINN